MRIAVLDDEPFFRHLLVHSLRQAEGITVAGEHDSAAAFLDALAETQPEAVILDLVLEPGQPLDSPTGGLATGLEVRRRLPTCGIVILSNHASAEVLQRVPQEELGGWAYLLKRRTDDIAEVVHALHATCAGDTMIDPTIIAESATPERLAEALSAHQLRVLRLLAGGASNALIAEQIGASPKSVEHAISGILDQLAIDARDPTTNARVTAAVSYIRLLGATA